MGTIIVVIGRLEVGDIVVDARGRSRGSHWGPVVIGTGSFVVGSRLGCAGLLASLATVNDRCHIALDFGIAKVMANEAAGKSVSVLTPRRPVRTNT